MNFIKPITRVLFLISVCANAQSLNNVQQKYIDSLTSHWNKDNSPGGALAILYKGEVILKKTNGMARVKELIPITPQTSFQLAQLSNSFIAFAILQLHYGEKLSLDEPVHMYIANLKGVASDLKIRHLLQHSSGIHDFEVLKNIAGWSDDSPFSINSAMKFIENQNSLSFDPGSEFAISRSNMLLASQVIAKASQMDFPIYMETHIFQPLGMKNTFVLTPENQNDQQIATSYAVDEKNLATPFKSKKETYAGVNIVSSLNDMILWEMNLLVPTSKTKTTVNHYNTYVTLEDGSQYNVPSGKLIYGQRNIHKERGIETTMSTGGIDGFASAVFNFPSEDFTVITLSNNGESYNGYIGMLSAHSVLGDAFKEPASIDFNAIKTIPLDKEYTKRYEGLYWDALGELSREIKIENDTLRYVRSNGYSTALIPLSKDRFQMKTDFDDEIFLTFKQINGRVSMKYAIGEATPFDFVKYSEEQYSSQELNARYSGNYYCEVLGIGYKFKAKEGTLVASNIKADEITFLPILEDLFSGNKWYLGSIDFQKDKKGKVNGFFVRNDAIRNLWFKKID